MENEATGHAGDRLAGEADAGEHGLRCEVGSIGLAVCRLDRGMIDQTSQRPAYGAIPICRRRPFDLLDGAAGLGDGVRERFEPQVEHTGPLPKQIRHRRLPDWAD